MRWAAGKAERDDVPFRVVAHDLTKLLKEFGPQRQSYHPEYPFRRLQRDGIWVVHSDGPMAPRASNTDPLKSELLAQNARGGFPDDVKAALTPAHVTEIAVMLLETHFPESIHQDILNAVGLTLGSTALEKKRDPRFRHRVLTAYEFRCAVCGFDVRLGSISIALDAAHIRWHQAGGPDTEANGLALCVRYHKTFDLGAFTLAPDGVLLVSDQANGSVGFAEALTVYHGKSIRSPQRPEFKPANEFLVWHQSEVFKGEARHRE